MVGIHKVVRPSRRSAPAATPLGAAAALLALTGCGAGGGGARYAAEGLPSANQGRPSSTSLRWAAGPP